ncbi:MAG: peptide deformylase [Patescibacteria group bacterium]
MKILTYPNKILEKKAKKIKKALDPEIQALAKNMMAILKEADGAGLAAPQVGKLLRLCVIQNDGEIFALINPKITSYSREKEIGEEGCLSFPGKFLLIKRSKKVKVRFLNEKGVETKLKTDGLLARIIQHEIDHLDGILFIERAKKWKKKI